MFCAYQDENLLRLPTANESADALSEALSISIHTDVRFYEQCLFYAGKNIIGTT